MLITKRNLVVVIGLAMIGLFFGQVLSAVAATTAIPASHANSLKKVAALPAGHKSHKKAQTGTKTPALKGVASIYSDKLSGRKTSSGQRLSQEKLTAAHRSLPMGTKVLVTNLHNNKTVEVYVNDRGPFHRDRVIDLTSAAASKLGMKKRGYAQVKLEVVNGQGVNNS
ncbi:MAG: septal ring lytic transglycosylase RlpA family protein [Desulfobulbus sp.]|nr:septal ring lytic transglycosylase RlpA family protein [Desulfobulbus sp.]